MSVQTIPASWFLAVGPVLIFTALAFVALVWGALASRAAARGSLWLGLVGSALSIAMAVMHWEGIDTPLFSGMIAGDSFSMFFMGLTAAITAAVLLLSRDYLEKEGIHIGEYYSLLFFCVAGTMLLAMSADLMMLFIALELMSLAAYVLTGFNRGTFTAIEGALKYFILGSFASAFMLLGISFIYGATGTTQLSELHRLIGSATDLSQAMSALARDGNLTPEVLPLGVGLLFLGMAFKIGAAPFQMWVPDVYQGAPAPVTAFMSTAIKAGAFAAFVRIITVAVPGLESLWGPLVAGAAALTMLVGNAAALAQRDVKRMLAYSSIAHGGYALMGLLAVDVASKSDAVGTILTYLVAYAVMNVGALAVIIALENKLDVEVTDLDSYGGLGFKYPLIGGAMTLFLISLGGLPPTAGFIAKFNLFSAVVGAGYTWLVLLALVTSMMSMYYYLRVVVYMYMRPEYGEVSLRPSALPTVVVGIAAVLVLALGLFPSSGPIQVLEWARESVQALTHL